MPNRPPERLDLQEYLPYRLSVAANAVSRLIARAYEDEFGLTIPQWRLMAVLGDEGALTQQSLCGRTLMDKVTVMRAAGSDPAAPGQAPAERARRPLAPPGSE